MSWREQISPRRFCLHITPFYSVYFKTPAAACIRIQCMLLTPSRNVRVRRAGPFALALLLALTAGCVRYEEHAEVDASGKGSITLVLQRPPGAAQETVHSRFTALFRQAEMGQDLPPSVNLDWSRTESSEGVIITATYTFDSIDSLLNWAARHKSPLSNISVERSTGSLEFSRRFAQISAEDLDMVKAYCSDMHIAFSFKGPGHLVASNATKTDGATATWEFKAPELFDPPGRLLTARYSTLWPWWVYTLLALALVAALTMIVRRQKRNRETS